MDNQYTNDIFKKLGILFTKGKKILDIGCGPGFDAEVFIEKYGLETHGIDIYKHQNIAKIKRFSFKKAGVYKIPHKSNSFDYVYLHDVMHHMDEENQSKTKHIAGLKEIKRVCKRGGSIIILEANRFNPLSYPHMVLLRGHNHFTQNYFVSLIKEVFEKPKFKHFEAHYYPQKLLKLFKIYEYIMESLPIFKPFLMYNLAVIKK